MIDRSHAIPAFFLLLLGATLVACGGGRATQPDQAGQSKLMRKTFAGQNKCDSANHNRPFVIEWDATDMSSFQAFTTDDVVLVKYEGCELQVLDGCRNDAKKGTFGAYKPVTWTSGGVETIDVADEAELYAKLPLGAVSLAPRVESGEKFHMEYYVSGTRTANRDAIWRGDLTKNPACATATHFVYGYNTGAFALASRSKLGGEVGGSYFGFGAGAKSASTSAADKKGGVLSSCAGDSAKEVDTCKVPIRLTLRPVSEGQNPTPSSATPEPDAALRVAQNVAAQTDSQKEAEAHLKIAMAKIDNELDGRTCLAELDKHDQLDPRPSVLSTNPAASYYSRYRAMCLMAAGQCAAGKALFRKQLMTSVDPAFAGTIDLQADTATGMYCRGGTLTPRDQLLVAVMAVDPNIVSPAVATCQASFDTIKKLSASFKDDADERLSHPEHSLQLNVPMCFAKAGDCARAFDAYRKAAVMQSTARHEAAPAAALLRSHFETDVPRCKGH